MPPFEGHHTGAYLICDSRCAVKTYYRCNESKTFVSIKLFTNVLVRD